LSYDTLDVSGHATSDEISALIARPPSAHRARSYSDIWFPFWNMPRSGLIITLPTITAMARRNRFIVRFPLDARHCRAGGKPP
jgi:hypothetical protein